MIILLCYKIYLITNISPAIQHRRGAKSIGVKIWCTCWEKYFRFTILQILTNITVVHENIAYSINLVGSLETIDVGFEQFGVEYVIAEQQGYTVIRYKPQANRHMLSAYAKYTMQSGNNRQTPADVHGERTHTFAHVSVGSVCEIESKDWANTLKKAQRKSAEKMEMKEYSGCVSL